MLNSITDFFENHLSLNSKPVASKQNDEKVRLAAAIVMVELTQVTLDSKPEDSKVVIEELSHYYSLSKEAAILLENQAEQADKSLTSLFPFTQLLNQHYSKQDKYRLINALWDIAYQTESADQLIAEDAYCHKISHLLHIPHAQLIQAKLTAEQKYQVKSK
ncbi:MAG: hypothetical protein methR_P1244 [Methyloprofundus sp.]|nr:MAG: hypothetical protein methR_P1244 [Methyloprofundus sp.]